MDTSWVHSTHQIKTIDTWPWGPGFTVCQLCGYPVHDASLKLREPCEGPKHPRKDRPAVMTEDGIDSTHAVEDRFDDDLRFCRTCGRDLDTADPCPTPAKETNNGL